MKPNPNTIIHGECFIFESVLPSDAVQENLNPDLPYVIIADSETTGNHHVIERKPSVKFFNSGNRRFMQTAEPTNVKCLIPDRHDAIALNPGTYEIGISQEYDYVAEAMRNVRD